MASSNPREIVTLSDQKATIFKHKYEKVESYFGKNGLMIHINHSIRVWKCQSCQVYCFLGIFPFFYIKFRASEFIQLIPIIYNHKILEESNKHAAVGSEV